MKALFALAAAAALSGCMSLDNLEERAPVFEWKSASSDYHAIAQCVYSGHVSKYGAHGEQLSTDKSAKKSMIVATTDFGPTNAMVFDASRGTGTEVRAYSLGSSLNDNERQLVVKCSNLS